MAVETVSIIGLGKLGLPLAVCFATSGYTVIGVDNNPDVVAEVGQGRSHVFEPGLQDLMATCRDTLSTVHDVGAAIRDSDVTFITVPTPSDPDGSFSSRYVQEAGISIGKALREKDSFHVVTLVSTVMPGTTADVLRPALESASGKVAGQDFGLCYNPEFIALGSVIRDLKAADFVLIGESDPESGAILQSIYQRICTPGVPVSRMSLHNAELAKIAINTFVTTKITFANMLADLCEKMPGGDVDAVTGVVGLDSRIGSKYLKGGMSYGGPCFPRDSIALSTFARLVGTTAELADATDSMNQKQPARIVDAARQKLGTLSGKRVALLGLTYKPDTNVTERSGALDVASKLLEEGATVSAYDPSGATLPFTESTAGTWSHADSAVECLEGSDICIMATPWPEFQNLSPADFGRMRTPVLLDCWRFLDRDALQGQVDYLAVGVQIESPALAELDSVGG